MADSDPDSDPSPESSPESSASNLVDLKAARRAAARPVPSGDWRDRLITTEAGGIAKRITNALILIDNQPELAGKLARCVYGYREVWLQPPPWHAAVEAYQLVNDDDITLAAAWLERQGMVAGRDTTAACLAAIASRRLVNPVGDYLTSLKWDGRVRLNNFFPYYFGAPDTEYIRAINYMWPISAVARALEPGCKVDTVLVLEGSQGLKKSSALKTLFGRRWVLDSLADVGNKDAALQLGTFWCVELPELDHFGRAAVNTIKRWISTAVDNYRPPYMRYPIDVPRPSIFVATHNPSALGWQSDETGGRRYWPVDCTAIDLDALAYDRDQIWAEAVAAYQSGEPWWFDEATPSTALDEARQEQEKRRPSDAWGGLVAEFMAHSTLTRITAADILRHIGLPPERWTARELTRVGIIVTGLPGWRKTRVMINGHREWLYERTE